MGGPQARAGEGVGDGGRGRSRAPPVLSEHPARTVGAQERKPCQMEGGREIRSGKEMRQARRAARPGPLSHGLRPSPPQPAERRARQSGCLPCRPLPRLPPEKEDGRERWAVSGCRIPLARVGQLFRLAPQVEGEQERQANFLFRSLGSACVPPSSASHMPPCSGASPTLSRGRGARLHPSPPGCVWGGLKSGPLLLPAASDPRIFNFAGVPSRLPQDVTLSSSPTPHPFPCPTGLSPTCLAILFSILYHC